MTIVKIFTKEPEVVFRLIERHGMAERHQVTYPKEADMLLTFDDDRINQDLEFWLMSAVVCGLIKEFKVQIE